MDLQAQFRDAMAQVSAPVTVVTTTVDDVASGSTVSAFSSLSVDPPMVVFALDNAGLLVSQVRLAGRLGINVLAADQAQLAVRFATRGLRSRFEGIAWHADHGLPRLDGAAAWLRCETIELVPGGDHTIVLGTVTQAVPSERDSLTYYMRRFGSASAAVSALNGPGAPGRSLS